MRTYRYVAGETGNEVGHVSAETYTTREAAEAALAAARKRYGMRDCRGDGASWGRVESQCADGTWFRE